MSFLSGSQNAGWNAGWEEGSAQRFCTGPAEAPVDEKQGGPGRREALGLEPEGG